MSRIAKNSINISNNVTCKFENGSFYAKGKLGEMSLVVNDLFKVEINEKEIHVLPKDDKDKLNPNWGTTRSLINNIVQGVDEGFSKTLELNGTGYRASVSGNKLKLQLGVYLLLKFKVRGNAFIQENLPSKGFYLQKHTSGSIYFCLIQLFY